MTDDDSAATAGSLVSLAAAVSRLATCTCLGPGSPCADQDSLSTTPLFGATGIRDV